MISKRVLAGALAAASLAATATPASAATILPSGTLDPLNCNANNTLCNKSFGYDVAAGITDFVKTVTFTLPMLGTVGSSVTSEFTFQAQDLDFTSILIDGLYAFTQTEFDGMSETWKITGLTNLGAGEHTIEFAGTAAGEGSSFGGSLTFAAVPEPATWLMMILGFGLLGGVMRRRQEPRVRYDFA